MNKKRAIFALTGAAGAVIIGSSTIGYAAVGHSSAAATSEAADRASSVSFVQQAAEWINSSPSVIDGVRQGTVVQGAAMATYAQRANATANAWFTGRELVKQRQRINSIQALAKQGINFTSMGISDFKITGVSLTGLTATVKAAGEKWELYTWPGQKTPTKPSPTYTTITVNLLKDSSGHWKISWYDWDEPHGHWSS